MKLKDIRMYSRKTQREVASAINLTQFTYSNYETGKTQPDFETVIKLADFFKTTTDNILGHSVPYLLDKSLLSEKQKKALEVILKLDDTQVQRILDFATGITLKDE